MSILSIKDIKFGLIQFVPTSYVSSIIYHLFIPPTFYFSLSRSPPPLSVSPLLSLFLKSAYVLRGILLSPDTNLHKVHAIIGSREANYFPGNITLPPSFIIY